MKNVITELMKFVSGIFLVALFMSGSCSRKYSRDYAPLPDGSYVHNGYEKSPEINQYGTFEKWTPSYLAKDFSDHSKEQGKIFADALAEYFGQAPNDLQLQEKLDERDRQNEAKARKEKERSLRAYKKDVEWKSDRYLRQSRPYSSSN